MVLFSSTNEPVDARTLIYESWLLLFQMAVIVTHNDATVEQHVRIKRLCSDQIQHEINVKQSNKCTIITTGMIKHGTVLICNSADM